MLRRLSASGITSDRVRYAALALALVVGLVVHRQAVSYVALTLFALPFAWSGAARARQRTMRAPSAAELRRVGIGRTITVARLSPQGTDLDQVPLPERSDAQFEIGSVTKVFTALLLASAVTDGTVRLEDPVGAYLEVRGDLRAATLHSLATHTSGLARLPRSPRLWTAIVTGSPDPYAFLTPERWVALASASMRRTSDRIPFVYSNLAFEVLAAALSTATGLAYEQLLQQRICEPLAMTGTSLRSGPLLVAGHDRMGLPVPPWTGVTGSGGIRSTATDLAIFIRAYLEPASTSLGAPMRLTMLRPSIGGAPRPLGWQTAGSPDDPIYWHNGGTGGFGTFVGFRPETKCGVAVLVDRYHSRAIDNAGFSILRSSPTEPIAPGR